MFLGSCGGAIGVLLLPLLLLAGIATIDDGVYPFQTARAPLVLYLTAAGAAFTRGLERSSARVIHAAVGSLNGVLVLWHGASFAAAAVVSSALLSSLAVRAARSQDDRRETLVRSVLLVAPLLALASVLVLPQLLRYGRLTTPDTARLWLEKYYNGGNDPGAFLRLALMPRGWDAVWLGAFCLAFALARERRRQAIPLVLAFASTKALAHLGFVLHSTKYPWWAALGSKLLVVPPHTLNDAGEFALTLMKLFVVAVAAVHACEAAVPWARRLSRGRPGNELLIGNAALALAAVFAVGVHFVLSPRSGAPVASELDEAWVDFANDASRLPARTLRFSAPSR